MLPAFNGKGLSPKMQFVDLYPFGGAKQCQMLLDLRIMQLHDGLHDFTNKCNRVHNLGWERANFPALNRRRWGDRTLPPVLTIIPNW